MQVFKAYFKVIRKNMLAMSIYIFVFVILAFLLTLFFGQPNATSFKPVKIRTAIIQEDAGSDFSKNLATWLGSQAVVVDLEQTQDSLQDALFYRDVEYILTIPSGFGASMMDRHYDVNLDRTIVPDSYTSIQMDLQIDQYLNLAALYLDSLPGITAGELAEKIDHDMKAEAVVTMKSAEGNQGPNKMTFFFIYLTYSIMAVMILGVTSIMLVFNKSDLRRRNLGSPVNPLQFNLQLVLGNLIFALAIWLIMCVLSLLLGSQPVNAVQYLILCLNALIFTMTALSFSFLVSQFIGSRAAQQSIANVFSLGACFISGVFVPQDMLGKTVHTIASFTPTYWYVRAVNEIGGLSSFNMQTLRPAGTYMLIEIGFALALLAVSLAVIKQKRQSQA